jgi:UDPglucose 6-dehydrogenase
MDLHVCGDGPLSDAIIYGILHKTKCRFLTLEDAELVWIAWDTPTNDLGYPDHYLMLAKINHALERVRPGTIVVLSSQLRVGTCQQLETEWPNLTFFVVPENIRADKAISDWLSQKRIVIGSRSYKGLRRSYEGDALNDSECAVISLVEGLADEIIWMDPESAEMSKHALNGYLAMCISYINEIAEIAESVDADPVAVALALVTDKRVSNAAPLRPGDPFSSGHLERELYNMRSIGNPDAIDLINAIGVSNEKRKQKNFIKQRMSE